jgi:hypothetical protein
VTFGRGCVFFRSVRGRVAFEMSAFPLSIPFRRATGGGNNALARPVFKVTGSWGMRCMIPCVARIVSVTSTIKSRISPSKASRACGVSFFSAETEPEPSCLFYKSKSSSPSIFTIAAFAHSFS